jgi:hypothetical protein
MPCETCRGSGYPGMVLTRTGYVPCPNGCIGNIASCCDAAGSAQPAPELRRPCRGAPLGVGEDR